MKKILFIIQSYPSEKSANVLCDEKIIRQLVASGNYEVHCLCARYNGQSKDEVLDDVHVHRWERGHFWRIFTWAMHNEYDWKAKLIYKFNRFFTRIKQLLTIPIFPVMEPLTCLKCAKAAERVYQEYKFDIVWAECFGIETLMAGYVLKKHHPWLRFVPVFWDALSGGLGVKYLPKAYTLTKTKELERKVLEIADMPIALKSHEEHLKQLWHATSFIQRVKFLDIPRFDASARTYEHEAVYDFDPNQINIVFSGNIGLRDPEYVFQLLSASGKGRVVVWFFTSRKFEKQIQKVSSRYDVPVKTMGYVAHDVLEKYLHNADIFLNLGVDTDCLIPSKIFEYMSNGKMIISTYVNEKDPCIQYFEKYPGAVLIRDGTLRGSMEEDIMRIDAMLSRAKGYSFDSSKLAELFYLNTPKVYYDALEDLWEAEQ